MTEKQLVKGCLDKDRVVQKLFFQKYAGKILFVSRMYSRTELEAEDNVQETFIKAFQNIHNFGFKSNLETWLKRIAINNALKNIKKKSFQNEAIGIPDYLDVAVVNDIIEDISFDEILSYIQLMPMGYRVVFTLNVLDGYSHNEIAEKLDITPSTSRSQLTKARKMLQKIITSKQKIPIHE